ncbi:CoA-transferase subunit beta [Haloarcula nitratireducens]|uniref:CoA-transferase subunit beta n=1 Tax=Haloarcula nitratireducens TaxID=2487749 RepID=A0AAW4PIL8_9EURY|nr:CoA-transferase [Halomicroarcula nitratireducens]MBX0297493.1 CoA-transferase subunit beta [Halomicroarcula nitratireducens]
MTSRQTPPAEGTDAKDQPPDTLSGSAIDYPVDVERPHEAAEDYSLTELLAVSAAHEIENGELAFIGVGMSLISGVLAKHTRSPDCQLVTESGYVGSRPPGVVQSISDTVLGVDALFASNQFQIFTDNQRGLFDVGIIGAGQIDRYGNTNSTVVTGKDGTYAQPKVRLPGSGGSNDIMTSCGRSVVMMRQDERAFTTELDYRTAPGHLDGGDSRDRAGFRGNGPSAVLTDMAVFRFDDDGEMVLTATHPNVSVADVREEVQWDLQITDDVATTPEPTRGEIAVLRAIDPTDTVLRGSDYIYEVGFEEWSERVMEQWKTFQNSQ